MILEKATLNVKVNMEAQFETDFKLASQYISATKGYINHQLLKCMEVENKYLLLVKWRNLKDHTIGFRSSEDYLKWKALLHHYYDPFSVVEHYETVLSFNS